MKHPSAVVFISKRLISIRKAHCVQIKVILDVAAVSKTNWLKIEKRKILMFLRMREKSVFPEYGAKCVPSCCQCYYFSEKLKYHGAVENHFTKIVRYSVFYLHGRSVSYF